MSIVLQCQACGRVIDAPSSWNSYKGPWRCDTCHARHSVVCSMGHLETLGLRDAFAPGVVACSCRVRSDVREAVAAYNAQAPRAAVVMLRRALQRACCEKGARGNKLWEQIRDLEQRTRVFDSAHASLATATRLFGNFGAHPNDDLLDDLAEDEARRALDLGLYLINKMYS